MAATAGVETNATLKGETSMNTTIDLANLPAPVSKTRHSIWSLVALLVGALVPVLVALVLLGSALLHRPLFARLLRRWPALARAAAVEGHAVVTRMTVIWGIGLLVIGGLQGAAELAGLSLTDPIGILLRAVGSLALEAVLYIASNAYLEIRSRT
jgi:hypothetical protein